MHHSYKSVRVILSGIRTYFFHNGLSYDYVMDSFKEVRLSRSEEFHKIRHIIILFCEYEIINLYNLEGHFTGN